MENDSNLLNVINEKTCNQFNFLRLKQVFFDIQKNMCQVSLIYPSNVELLDVDKERIKQIIQEYLNISGTMLVIKINKSFVERDLIEQEIFNYFNKYNPQHDCALRSRLRKRTRRPQI